MTDLGTSRRYRPDPFGIGLPETWGRGQARATLTTDAVVVCSAGEIDASNALKLSAYVERHAALAHWLYLDLREVTFFGTAGLAVLRRIEHQFGQSGAAWWLLAGPAVRKVLRICNAGDLPQLDTLDSVPGLTEATIGALGQRAKSAGRNLPSLSLPSISSKLLPVRSGIRK
jgi:anti-anti-sigma factor